MGTKADDLKLRMSRVVRRTETELPPKSYTSVRPTRGDLEDYLTKYQDVKRSDGWE